LILKDAYLTAAARSAPPQNKPNPSEISNCAQYLISEIKILEKTTKVIVTLGKIAFDTYSIRNHDHSYIEYNIVIINLLYKVCKSKDIDNNTMKPFIIGTSVDVLIGKINYKMFACKNSSTQSGTFIQRPVKT
jgi:hypothetical protein